MIINPNSITEIGRVLKAHGIHGELNVTLDVDIEYLEAHPWLIIEMGGIPTPFQIRSMRRRGANAMLICLHGVESVEAAKPFALKTVYTDTSKIQQWEDETRNDEEMEAEGMYADSLTGYSVYDVDNKLLGVIDTLNLSTRNALFEVLTPENKRIYIPIADEFITEIDSTSKCIIMTIPDGLLEMQ